MGVLSRNVSPSEVSIGGGLLEDGVLQLKVLDNTAGPQVKVLLDDLHELLLALGAGAVVKHGDGERLSHADGVGNLKMYVSVLTLCQLLS